MKTTCLFAGFLALALYGMASQVRAEGTWTALANQPAGNTPIQQMLLLSDGTVLAQQGSDYASSNWFKLTPDAAGHYVNGTWTTLPSESYTRLFESTVMLPNGKVFVAGGEYGSGSTNIEIYSPANNSWAIVTNSTYFGGIADGSVMMLSNGLVLIAPQAASSTYSGKTFTFNPANSNIVQTPGPVWNMSESTWVKLANDSILTIASRSSATGSTNAEVYIPSSGTWVDATTSSGTPLVWADFSATLQNGFITVSETGPASLLPNGNAIFFGGNGRTAIYNPTTATWTQGPSIPGGLVCADAPGAVLNNGKVLIQAGPAVATAPGSVSWSSSSTFFEFDYTANSGAGGFTQIHSPGGGLTNTDVTFICRTLNLPDGGILWTDARSQLYVYQPDGSPLAAGQPVIYSASQNADGSLHLTGTLFNGISQGSSYGDDAQQDSNYPLVRFTDAGGTVRYGRTYNWSSTSVMTGTNVLTTECTIPSGASLSDSIQVTANGIASVPVALNYVLNGITWVDFTFGGTQTGAFSNPWSSIAQGNFHASSGSLIEVKAGTSSETLTLSKPMRIVSYGGTVHIGP